MAHYRYIKAVIWDDEFIAGLSDAAFRLFIYCITNESTSLSGFYQKPMRSIAASIGKETKQVEALFTQLSGKVEYIDGWVCIKNYAKHQNVGTSPKTQVLIEKDLAAVPENILEEARRRFNTDTETDTETYTRGIGTPSIGYRRGIKTAQPSPKTPKKTSVEKAVDNEGTPYSEVFERAWSVYPKKVGKGAAWTAWGKLKPNASLAELIIAKIALYAGTKQWKKDEGQFIPHFATFLNQRRFDDEPEKTGVSHEKSKYDEVPSIKIS